ncbi:Lipase 1 [Candida maltosa Xu316]|uniref:Lipase n=1 Tax=Candida maltosa (strain Xu316) TaxID=1245528 RepID=M3HR52_CANMX|nr:Lipase 1 [Candida maltosa Xu316]
MKYFFSLFIFLAFAFASPLTLVPPSEDNFYTPPDGYEDAALGEILKMRKTPNSLSSAFFEISVKNSWQVLVRSEDSFGNATAIVTTIIEPNNADPSKVVSYQTFEDSSNINCSPSYGMQFGSPFSTIATQIDMTFMVPLLNDGYYVVSSDYEGPKSALGAGRQAGHAILDSIRAVLSSGNFTGIEDDAKVAIWGYSGGSLASGWAAALQPQYAPELEDNLIGIAVGGFVTTLDASIRVVDGELFSGFIPNIFNGYANEYPDFKETLYNEINANDTKSFSLGDELCMIPAILHFANTKFFTGDTPYFSKGFGFLDIPVIKDTLSENALINLDKDYMPQIPVFIYHGTLDAIVPIANVNKTYSNWCSWGIDSIEFAEDLTAGHLTETLVGAPAALTWLQARFNGEEPVKGCVHNKRLSNFFYPNISESTHSYFSGIYDAFEGLNLGPGLNSDNVTESGLFGLLGKFF